MNDRDPKPANVIVFESPRELGPLIVTRGSMSIPVYRCERCGDVGHSTLVCSNVARTNFGEEGP